MMSEIGSKYFETHYISLNRFKESISLIFTFLEKQKRRKKIIIMLYERRQMFKSEIIKDLKNFFEEEKNIKREK